MTLRGITHSLRKNFAALLKNREGVAYVEFALAAPLLLILFLGAVEFTRFLIITQKIEKASLTMSDVVAQTESVTTAQLDNLVQSVSQIMQPFGFTDTGYVIVSSITKTAGNSPVVSWQYTGGGSWTQTSRVGSSGHTALLPGNFTLNDGESVIIAEVYYNFSPMLGNQILHVTPIYRYAIFRPRLGDATTLG